MRPGAGVLLLAKDDQIKESAMKKILIAAIACFSFTTVHAAEAPYVGLDVAQLVFDTSTADPEFPAVRVRMGSEVTRYVGVETQLLRGVKEDEVSVTGGTMGVNLMAVAGVYLRLKLPLGDAVSLYGLAGYAGSWLDVTSHVPGMFSDKSGDKDFSGGGGIDIRLSKNTSISADYMEYTEGLTSMAVGLRIKL